MMDVVTIKVTGTGIKIFRWGFFTRIRALEVNAKQICQFGGICLWRVTGKWAGNPFKRYLGARGFSWAAKRREEKNLWLPWTWISLSCRRQGQDLTLRLGLVNIFTNTQINMIGSFERKNLGDAWFQSCHWTLCSLSIWHVWQRVCAWKVRFKYASRLVFAVSVHVTFGQISANKACSSDRR